MNNKSKFSKIVLILLISSMLFVLTMCQSQYKEIEKASYIAGYNTYLSFKGKDLDIDTGNVDEVIDRLNEEEYNVSSVDWDYFKEGYKDAVKGVEPEYKVGLEKKSRKEKSEKQE